MRINQTTVNIVYPRIDEYRKKFVLAEDKLKDHFLPATVLPIPEPVQEEVPRIIVQTQNGHSALNIALNVASFTTNYDGEFVDSWEKCKAYLEERCVDVYEIVNVLTTRNNYVGLVTHIVIDDFPESGLEILKRSLLNENGSKLGTIHDFSSKLTYVVDDQYFVNITVENLRRLNVEQLTDGRQIYKTENTNDAISVLIDVNDRFAANRVAYQSSKKAFDSILNVTADIINNKLISFIQKGELSI